MMIPSRTLPEELRWGVVFGISRTQKNTGEVLHGENENPFAAPFPYFGVYSYLNSIIYSTSFQCWGL